MKQIFYFAAALALCSMMAAPMSAQDSKIIEDGGTGAYKAIMVGESTLPTHTIFRPQDLSQFGKKNLLPILVWGNGACANSPREHLNFLSEIASHGFIIVAIGPSFGQQGGDQGGGMRAPGGGGSDSKGLLTAMEWAIAQNADKTSPYYQKLDVNNIAAAGMSCGGLQALDFSKDSRLKTIMVCNSGLFNSSNASTAVPGMPMPAKESLKDIHTPIIYILGGTTDIAYENGMDDFKQINHVPAFAANFPVGHGGTYMQPHGGEFAIVATAWLKWQLKSDKEAGMMFTGDECGLSKRENWTVDRKNIK